MLRRSGVRRAAGIRPAAAFIAIAPPADGSADGAWRTLLVQRHARARFMRSAFVFPGGCLEDYTDIVSRRAGGAALDDGTTVAAVSGTPGTSLDDFRRCAIREMHEEAGIDVADGLNFDRGVDAEVSRHLRAVAHWTTPSSYPHRYNTWFFAGRVPVVDGAIPPLTLCEKEIASGVWLTPREAVARHMAGRPDFSLPVTTLMVIETLAQHWPRYDHALEVLANTRHPLLPPDQAVVGSVAGGLPEHATAACRADACGVKHWYVRQESAAPHLAKGTFAYWVSNDLYGSPATRLAAVAAPSASGTTSTEDSTPRTMCMVHVS